MDQVYIYIFEHHKRGSPLTIHSVGSPLSLLAIILPSLDGDYRAHYCPQAGSSVSTNFTVTAYDTIAYSATPLVVKVNVVAPIKFANITMHEWNATANTPTLMSGKFYFCCSCFSNSYSS